MVPISLPSICVRNICLSSANASADANHAVNLAMAAHSLWVSLPGLIAWSMRLRYRKSAVWGMNTTGCSIVIQSSKNGLTSVGLYSILATAFLTQNANRSSACTFSDGSFHEQASKKLLQSHIASIRFSL